MSTNYCARSYNSVTTPMNIADLTVGQKLVRVVTQSGFNGPYSRQEYLVTVTKIMKTRLVVEDIAGRTSRILVEYSRDFPSRNGEVTDKIEGTASEAYYREAMILYTQDDPQLVIERERTAGTIAYNRSRANARGAASTFLNSTSVNDAAAAIKALQAFIDNNQES